MRLSESLAVRDAHCKMQQAKVCRLCLREEWIRPLTRHHIVPLRWFVRQGVRVRIHRNASANITPLCRDCHDRVESPDRATRIEARRYLRRSMTQQEVAFAIAVRGRDWFDIHYPLH
jgi:5-methylcytosine-specific restriction endonuclease McrA